MPQTTRSALPLLPLGYAAYMSEASLKKGDSRLKELHKLLTTDFADDSDALRTFRDYELSELYELF